MRRSFVVLAPRNFDVIVIGNGMMGSAAAKYLSMTGKTIACIGAPENLDVNQSHVYSSHYDQGRVQRLIDQDLVWSTLNAESVKCYPQLQRDSGIRFFTQCGCIYASTYDGDEYLKSLPESAATFGTPLNLRNTSELCSEYPQFFFPDNTRGYVEYESAGYINPRELIRAQTTMFLKKNGCFVEDTVSSVIQDDGACRVATVGGHTYSAEKVLLAPGAFVNFMNLLPRDKKLNVILKGETILLAELSSFEAKRLNGIPSLLYEVDTGEVEGVYLTPPMRYPQLADKVYLKMGCNLSSDPFFTDLEKIHRWFRGGHAALEDSPSRHNEEKQDQRDRDALIRTLHAVIPSLKATGYVTKRCILTRTPNRRQYIGHVSGGLYIATGGNGYSAMCSNELGRVAAHVVETGGAVPSPYSEKDFKPIFMYK
jgi:glycine/D-amino acid oxidase-like deaminating enzyme